MHACISPSPTTPQQYILRDDGTRQDLRYAPSTSGVALNVGWTVERHLRDDDIVLFNRQPR